MCRRYAEKWPFSDAVLQVNGSEKIATQTQKNTLYSTVAPDEFRNAASKLHRHNTQVVHYPGRIPGNNPQLSLDVHFVCRASGRNANGFYKLGNAITPPARGYTQRTRGL